MFIEKSARSDWGVLLQEEQGNTEQAPGDEANNNYNYQQQRECECETGWGRRPDW